MARIPYPDSTKLPPEVSELLQQAHLKVFSMWAHSVSTVGLVMNLGAVQFANLEVELVELVGYYWMLGRIATVFQVELDAAQGAELYDAGLKVAARSQQSPQAAP